jgi:hypothetical protein
MGMLVRVVGTKLQLETE